MEEVRGSVHRLQLLLQEGALQQCVCQHRALHADRPEQRPLRHLAVLGAQDGRHREPGQRNGGCEGGGGGSVQWSTLPPQHAQNPQCIPTPHPPRDPPKAYGVDFPLTPEGTHSPRIIASQASELIVLGIDFKRDNMFFYSESIEAILRKQNLSSYIESMIVSDKSARKVMPSPKLVQVVTACAVSDGVFDYPCTFTCEKFKKGSFLRMVKWEVSLRNCDLTIHEAQYLGGAGSEVQHGKKWDNDRLKMLANSSVISKHFLILHEPTPALSDPTLPLLNYHSLARALASPQEHDQDSSLAFPPREVLEKRRIPLEDSEGRS